MQTDKLFTGQRAMASLGIYHYNARFYSPKLGRFLSADTIVPNPFNLQDLNRYSYVRNSPLRYTDPTGHKACGDGEAYDCNGKRDRRVALGGPEKEFIRRAKSPLHKKDGPVHYSGFGGCNTVEGNCGTHHAAIDSRNDWGAEKDEDKVVNWVGRPIYAVEEGTVVKFGESDWGNYVMVQHIIDGERFYSIYAHLDSYDVELGMEVDNDTQIGEMGGSTSGGDIDPHLHFEVRKSVNVDITAVDPFNNQVWWPDSKDELTNNFVDLAAADFIDYDDNFSNWP